MLELDFETFSEELAKARRRKNEEKRYLQYSEDDLNFYLFIKSIDLWEYYSIVPKDLLVEFGASYDISNEEAIEDFRRSVLYDGIKLKSSGIEMVELEPNDELISFQDAPISKTAPVEKDSKDVLKYDKFLKSKFESWERQILRFLSETMSDELHKMYIENKTLGEFLQRLFNTIHTVGFMKGLTASIAATLKTGINEAENELNIDIGVGTNFSQQVEMLAHRQLNGFSVDASGTRWDGIKGVASDAQEDIRKIVLNGMNKRLGLEEVKNDIKAKMTQYTGGEVDGVVTEGRAMTIARTETNRIQNMGKLQAYKQSGLTGVKVWDSHLDNRTSPICKRLDGQKAALSDVFIDPKTGEQFEHPPSHPNCRSVIRFEHEE